MYMSAGLTEVVVMQGNQTAAKAAQEAAAQESKKAEAGELSSFDDCISCIPFHPTFCCVELMPAGNALDFAFIHFDAQLHAAASNEHACPTLDCMSCMHIFLLAF